MSKPLTPEFLRGEAAKYKTRGEFQKGSPSAYVVARRRKFLDEICAHMESPYTRWEHDALIAEASRFSTRTAFAKGSSAAYQAAQDRGLLDEICTHMLSNKLPDWSEEALAAEALKYVSRHEFSAGSYSAYRAARSKKLLDKICCHMTGLYKHHYWVDSEIYEAARHFRTRSDFQYGASKAYKAAFERGIVDAVCSHMPPPLSGFKRDDPAILYYLRVESIWAGMLYKIGITNSSVEMRYRDEKTTFKVLATWQFDDGKEAAKKEREILELYKAYLYRGIDRVLNAGGNTELFVKDVLLLDVGD